MGDEDIQSRGNCPCPGAASSVRVPSCDHAHAGGRSCLRRRPGRLASSSHAIRECADRWFARSTFTYLYAAILPNISSANMRAMASLKSGSIGKTESTTGCKRSPKDQIHDSQIVVLRAHCAANDAQMPGKDQVDRRLRLVTAGTADRDQPPARRESYASCSSMSPGPRCPPPDRRLRVGRLEDRRRPIRVIAAVVHPVGAEGSRMRLPWRRCWQSHRPLRRPAWRSGWMPY